MHAKQKLQATFLLIIGQTYIYHNETFVLAFLLVSFDVDWSLKHVVDYRVWSDAVSVRFKDENCPN